jgi:hypothetical protein
MAIDRERLVGIFEALGQKLGKPATICLSAPTLLSAAKLARGEPRDIEDVAWWIKERALSLDDIKAAITTLPDTSQRMAATENVVLADLVVARGRE